MRKAVPGFILVLALGVGSFYFLFAPKPSLKIGLLAPVTGQWASEGQAMVAVATLLANNINEKGGIRGRLIEIEVADDGGSPARAPKAAQKLVDDGVVAVLGSYGSAVTEAAQGVLAEAGVVHIATGATASQLSHLGGPLFFRVSPRDDEQGLIIVQTLITLGAERVALVWDHTTYAEGLAQELRRLILRSGRRLVYQEPLSTARGNQAGDLEMIRASQPDIIVYAGYFPDAGLLLKHKHKMGWDGVPVLGSDGTNNPHLVDIAGPDAAAGFYFVSPPGPGDIQGLRPQRFQEEFQERFNRPPASVWTLLTADAFLALTEAMTRVKRITPENLADYLHQELKNFPGVTGQISFDSQGDRLGGIYVLYRVDSEGKFVLWNSSSSN